MAFVNPSRAVFVRNLQSLVEIILTDHAYAKPWSAHPEASKAKPMRTLFLSKDEDKALRKSPEDELIDVCDPEPPTNSTIVYDTTKAKTVMSECEKHVTTVTSKRTPDTWEELICRTGWGSKQNSLFDKVIKVLSTLRLARLAFEQTPNEPVKRRIATDKATKRFRQILCSIEWDPKLTAWLHTTLVDGLSIPLLACYLDVLQTLRAKAPSLVDRIVSNHTSQRRGPAANAEALSLLLKRPWDPSHGLVTQHKTRKLPGSPLLLIVPSGPTTNTGSGTSSKRTRFWHNQLSVLGKVVPVTMHTSNGGSGVTISQCLDHIIGAVRTKVLELRSHFPNRPIILIGWSIGALVSCQVALMETVCAVVCLGFPLAGIDGVRGDVEDPLMELKTPVLFVIGSHSNLNSQEDIEEMRERLKAETSLLVVGGADEQLRLTRAKKHQEGLTQSMVDRLIMDQIGEFLGSVLTSNNNSMQQRNDLSDADETDIKKKKRKRSLSRDLSSETSGSGNPTKSKTSSQSQSPKKSQKVASSEAGKNVIKIPVGGTLGALSNVSRNLSQPTPAKKPRTSKSKSSKANTQTNTSGGTRTSDVGSVPMQLGNRTFIQGIPISASSASVPASLTSQTGQGFISLAAKGNGIIKPAVSQPYLTMSGVGSPSIIKTGAGSVQYIIKPQSQRHISVPLGLSSAGAVSQPNSSANQAVSGVTSSGIRYTSLSQSPTSPFTSVLNIKGQNNTAGIQPGTAVASSATTRAVASAPSSLSYTAATTGVRATVSGATSQQSEAVKRTNQGKPFVGQVLTSLPQHMVSSSGVSLAQLSSASSTSTTLSTSQTNVSQLASTAASNLVKTMNASQARSSVVNPQQSVVQLSSTVAGQLSKPVQIVSSRPIGNQSQVRYIVGSPSTSQAVSSLQGTVQASSQGMRTVASASQGRPVSQVATTSRAQSQVLTSQQLSNVRTLSASTPGVVSQQRASPGASPPQGTSRIQNLPVKGPLTRTIVLTTASGTAVRSASPQTSTLNKPQVYKPGMTTVTHVLTSSPRTATGSPKPQGNVTQTLTPTSVMLKGGTVVSMQSLLARLPHGTKVIASNSSDGNGNVYVVGNVLTQLQNASSRPKSESATPKTAASTTATATVTAKTTAPVKGTVISVSIPTSASSTQGSSQPIAVQQTNQIPSQASAQPSKPTTSSSVSQFLKDESKQKGGVASTSGGTEIQTEKPKGGDK